MMRESLLQKMRQGIDAGLAFPDAAQAAGIPYELVVGALTYDEELRGWFRECKGRTSLIRDEDAHVLPDSKSPRQLKRDTLNIAMGAGLGHRFAEVISNLRPVDEHGNIDLVHTKIALEIGKLCFALFPKEVEQTSVDEASDEPPSESKLMQQLIELRDRKRLQLEEKERAKAARESGGQTLIGHDDVAV